MLPLEGHYNFCLRAVMALAEGYPPADLLTNRSIYWLGEEKAVGFEIILPNYSCWT